MKCESCGNELIGAAIICRACNHNNALHMRLARRRAEPRQDQPKRSRANRSPVEIPTIVPRKDADVNLLHFPSALNRQAAPTRQPLAGSEPETAKHPPWRAELKERVRQIKEKRAAKEHAAPKPSPVQSSRPQTGEAKRDHNLIVESALNRIRWASRDAERRGDGATGRWGDRESESHPISQSPSHPVAQSPSRLVAQSLHPSVPPPLRSSGAGAPYKHTETQAIEIAQALELPRPKVEPATLYARLLAGVCDFEIVLAAFLSIFGAYAVSNNDASFAAEAPILIPLLLAAVVFIYQIVMLEFAGRTFGMALLKLNLIDTDDESLPVTRKQKLLRASAATIVFICFPLYLTAGFNASRRTLPDLISGTTVRGLRIEDQGLRIEDRR
jgi:uncharacterized RDD family membrane protein YckC